MDELTMSVARENGKNWAESEGDVLKAIEILGNRQEYARIVTEQDTPRK